MRRYTVGYNAQQEIGCLLFQKKKKNGYCLWKGGKGRIWTHVFFSAAWSDKKSRFISLTILFSAFITSLLKRSLRDLSACGRFLFVRITFTCRCWVLLLLHRILVVVAQNYDDYFHNHVKAHLPYFHSVCAMSKHHSQMGNGVSTQKINIDKFLKYKLCSN